MRHWLWRALGLGAALLRFATPLAAQDLAPTDTLPAALQAAVRASGCQVPHWPKFHNDGSVTPGPAFVWRAAVRTAGQVDWVVGCDRDHKRTALVFPRRSQHRVAPS